MDNLKRQNDETFLDYAERLIDNRQEYDLDKVEIYELLYGTQVSPDHARKMLTNLKMTIEEHRRSETEQVLESGEEDKDIELKKKYKETVEINKDGTQTSSKMIEMSEEESKDPNSLLEKHSFDSKLWQITSAKNSMWNMLSNKLGMKTLFSSKITVKPVDEYKWNQEDVQKLFDGLETNYKNKINIISEQYEENGNTLTVPIADFHYGMFADEYSTGNSYNLDIAEDLFYKTLNDIINRVKNKKFERVLFIVGNDFINADDSTGTTTKGTPQDNASSWFETIKRATQLIINGIDMLNKIAPVDVQYVMSNHDLHSMFGIMQTIEAWYRKDGDVNIDSEPLPRKYYRIGKTLLCLSHDIKKKQALEIITTEAKDQWSESENIVCLLAHLHQSMIYEKQGYLEIRRLPTISGWSRWANDKAYKQTERKNESFIINNELGIIDIINTVLKY